MDFPARDVVGNAASLEGYPLTFRFLDKPRKTHHFS